jgi:hypothetical protein
MAYVLNKKIITKRIIDVLVDFLKQNLSRNRLYRHVDISDRFPLEQVQIPMVVIRSVTNNQRRIHFDDFMEDYHSRVTLVPVQADDNLYGNNMAQVNLPETLDYDPRWPWDVSVGYPSGTDITQTIFTSGNVFNSGVDTGIIITVPGSGTFDPSSIMFADENRQSVGSPSLITGNNTYTLTLSQAVTNDQFYLNVTGTDMTGTVALAVEPNQMIVNGSGIASGLSGTRIFMSDILFAGDQYQLNTTPNEELAYAIYGGIYNMSISIDCYARTTIEAEELGDIIEDILTARKLDFYDRTGASITSQSQGGGTEREYANEHLFQTSVSIELFKEWQEYRSVTTILSASGTAIPNGIYSGTYVAPGVYTITALDQAGVDAYFSSYVGWSGTGANIQTFQIN